MSTMEFLKDYLIVNTLIRDDEKIELDYKAMFEFSEFTKILNENVTKDKEGVSK